MTKRILLLIMMIWAMYGIATAQKLIVESVKTGTDGLYSKMTR